MRSRGAAHRAGTGVESSQVGVDHLLVAADAEQQRHVDVDAEAGELLDRAQSGLVLDLDHHVRLIEAPPELERLGDGRLGVVGEIRRAFERHETVAPVARVVGRAQLPRRSANVIECELEEQLLQIALASGGELRQLGVVAVGASNRGREDRRV